MSSYGLCTLLSEALLVQPMIVYWGEINTIRIGLAAFSFQCFLFSLNTSTAVLYLSFLLSMFSSLVYPTICSLLANNVDPLLQGESLGVLNGIKALTEGLGPLIFGSLMGAFASSPTPSIPYLPAAMLVLWALMHSYESTFGEIKSLVVVPDPQASGGKDNASLNSTQGPAYALNAFIGEDVEAVKEEEDEEVDASAPLLARL